MWPPVFVDSLVNDNAVAALSTFKWWNIHMKVTFEHIVKASMQSLPLNYQTVTQSNQKQKRKRFWTPIFFLIHIFIEYDNIYIYTPRSTILTLSKCQVQHPDHHGAGILTPKILTISRSSWQTLHAFYGISYPVVGREPVAPVSQPRDSIAQRPIFCFCPDWPKDLAVGLLARGWSGGCPRLLGATHFEPMSPVAPNRQAHHLIPPLPRLFCI